MKFPGRSDLLIVGAGLAAILFGGASFFLISDLDMGHSVALLLGAVAAVVLVVEAWRHCERALVSRAAKRDERGNEERNRDLEALTTFGQALGRARDLEAIRLAAAHYLPGIARAETIWVLLRDESDWTAFTGELREPELPRRIAQANRVLNGTASLLEQNGTVVLPMMVSGTLVGVLGTGEDGPPRSAERRRLLEAATFLLGSSIRHAELLDQVREHCARDPLTGCFTAEYGQQAIEAELRRARRSQQALSLLVLDLDRFKAVNDQYGRACGDAVLATVGRRMRDVLRGSDLKCRWDEEQFLVLLPETGLKGARRVAETLRREIGDRPFPWTTEALTVTASFGLTQTLPGEVSLSTPLGRAREALSRAKNEGRNCVRLSADALAEMGAAHRLTPVEAAAP